MMKYLVILLSDQSTSFCHYDSCGKSNGLIPLETLQNAIKYAFMEDLYIQFVLPSFNLPEAYEAIISSTKSSIIAPASLNHKANVIIIDGFAEFTKLESITDASYVLRTGKDEFFENYKDLSSKMSDYRSLNLVFTDVEKFTDTDLDRYKTILEELVHRVKDIILSGKTIQTNILTDRLIKTTMNNCNAGNESITLAPDGKFYICPAFYYANEQPVGDLKNGLMIKNAQLFKLAYAPLCRECDAYQCKRCVYLNKVMTREVNIPSREQCVMAHIERNASRLLLLAIREHLDYMPKTEIKEITYLDPFDNIKNKQS